MVPVISVPDLRDYWLINRFIERLLDQGQTLIQLVGVERQRLLLSGLRGPWSGRILVEGNPGPEFAAEFDCPGLVVDCRGSVSDGAARALRAGCLVVHGRGGDAIGLNQRGGLVLVLGGAGDRVGLEMIDGILGVVGSVGRLLGERQRGGRILIDQEGARGPYVRHGALGGRVEVMPSGRKLIEALAAENPACSLGVAPAEPARAVEDA